MRLNLSGTGAILKNRPWLEWLIPVVFCMLLAGQLWLSVGQLSQTADEPTHLYSGYRTWKCSDYEFSREHPPLAKLIGSASLLGSEPAVDCAVVDRRAEADESLGWLHTNREWEKLLFRARVAVSVFAIGVCILVWIVARLMFGLTTAVMAVSLLAFEPNILAHGALVTTDMALTFTLLLVVYSFYRWVTTRLQPFLLLTGLAVGLTLVAKISGIVVAPLLCILAIADAYVRPDDQRPRWRIAVRNVAALAVVFVIAAGVIWAAYGMRYTARLDGTPVLRPASANEPLLGRLLFSVGKAHIMPAAYIEGFRDAMTLAEGEDPVFILGRMYPHGQWFFFPLVMTIKYTTGFLALFLGASVVLAADARRYRRELLFLLVPACLFLAVCMRARMNSGVRHILPILPFLLILAAAGSMALIRQRPWAKYALVCLLVLHAVSSLHAFPHYLSYANELWGGPTRLYKHLPWTDWGEAYPQVKNYLAKHPAANCWFITDFKIDPRVYGVPCQPVGYSSFSAGPTRMHGTVFVSSSFVSHREGTPTGLLSPFAGLQPKAHIGGSAVLVYEGDFDTTETASESEQRLAFGYLLTNRIDAALLHAQRAVQLTPEIGKAHLALCVVLLEHDAREQARAECASAERLLRNDPLRRDWLRATQLSLQALSTSSARSQ